MLGVATAEQVRRDGPWSASAKAFQRHDMYHRQIVDADRIGHRDEDRDVGHLRTYAEHSAILEARMQDERQLL